MELDSTTVQCSAHSCRAGCSGRLKATASTQRELRVVMQLEVLLQSWLRCELMRKLVLRCELIRKREGKGLGKANFK